MAVYQTTFEINAPATRVGHALTDLSNYLEWNPQVPKAGGRIEEGSREFAIQPIESDRVKVTQRPLR